MGAELLYSFCDRPRDHLRRGNRKLHTGQGRLYDKGEVRLAIFGLNLGEINGFDSRIKSGLRIPEIEPPDDALRQCLVEMVGVDFLSLGEQSVFEVQRHRAVSMLGKQAIDGIRLEGSLGGCMLTLVLDQAHHVIEKLAGISLNPKPLNP